MFHLSYSHNISCLFSISCFECLTCLTRTFISCVSFKAAILWIFDSRFLWLATWKLQLMSSASFCRLTRTRNVIFFCVTNVWVTTTDWHTISSSTLISSGWRVVQGVFSYVFIKPELAYFKSKIKFNEFFDAFAQFSCNWNTVKFIGMFLSSYVLSIVGSFPSCLE